MLQTWHMVALLLLWRRSHLGLSPALTVLTSAFSSSSCSSLFRPFLFFEGDFLSTSSLFLDSFISEKRKEKKTCLRDQKKRGESILYVTDLSTRGQQRSMFSCGGQMLWFLYEMLMWIYPHPECQFAQTCPNTCVNMFNTLLNGLTQVSHSNMPAFMG